MEKRYKASCQSDFWTRIFEIEADYLTERLNGCRDVLSVGCGPAVIEGLLAGRGYRVTGLDVTPDALQGAPDAVRTVCASAERMPIPDASFDAAVFVASLQFIHSPESAIREAARVVRSNGRIIVLLLNPKSLFVAERLNRPDSYVNRIKHTDTNSLVAAINDHFIAKTEYFLGINGEQLDPTDRTDAAALISVYGQRRNNRSASDQASTV